MKSQTPEQRVKAFEKKQIIVSVLALLLLSGIAVVFNALHLQNVAEENTRFLSRMVKLGDFREASLVLQQARLSNFTKIQYISSEPDHSFTIPAKAEIFKNDILIQKITTDEIVVPIEITTATQSEDKIVFEYERFRLVPYAVLIWFILNLISIPQTRFLKRRLLEQFHRDMEIEKTIVKSEIAQQVRHNLRTPLAALMRIPSKLPESVAKERDLLELTIGQIRSLIAKLDDRPHEHLTDSYALDIYKTLEQAKREISSVTPKAIEFEFDIEDIVASALVKHIPHELRSVIGNIVTNSIEAIHSTGKILVRVRDLASEISISVTDTGSGIKPESLPKVFDRNFSEGKKNGSGIGLSHAKENIESWGGRISIESTLEVGTTITIHLPISERASWYLPRLKFNSRSKIYVLDDQDSALELWRLKLEEADLLQQAVLLKEWTMTSEILTDAQNCTFLFDYDLTQEKMGLELLRELPKNSTRCLVTGNFDNQELRRACEQEDVFLLPKEQIADLAMVIT